MINSVKYMNVIVKKFPEIFNNSFLKNGLLKSRSEASFFLFLKVLLNFRGKIQKFSLCYSEELRWWKMFGKSQFWIIKVHLKSKIPTALGSNKNGWWKMNGSFELSKKWKKCLKVNFFTSIFCRSFLNLNIHGMSSLIQLNFV